MSSIKYLYNDPNSNVWYKGLLGQTTLTVLILIYWDRKPYFKNIYTVLLSKLFTHNIYSIYLYLTKSSSYQITIIDNFFSLSSFSFNLYGFIYFMSLFPFYFNRLILVHTILFLFHENMLKGIDRMFIETFYCLINDEYLINLLSLKSFHFPIF